MTQNLDRVDIPPQNAEREQPTRTADPNRWWRRIGLLALVAIIGGFLIYTVPPYTTLDPKQSKTPLNPDIPAHYTVLVVHILFGTIALLTVCLQVWPWLLRRHPAVHRWVGRTYVFAGALPAATTALLLNVFHVGGWHADLGAATHSVLWITTTMIGYVALRKRQYLKHRRWMLYSFGLSTGIVWGLATFLFLKYFLPKATFYYIYEMARWAGWMVNIALVKLYLDRTASRPLRLQTLKGWG